MQEENVTEVTFSRTLSELMKSKGVRAIDLAGTLGLSHPAIGKWLKGTVPNGKELMKLARVFDVSMEHLLTGSKGVESIIVRESGSGCSVKQDDAKWRDRAIAAEHKVTVLKSGLEGLLKKI
jgi:transcriptional regulator with XRE-family HTH domain